VSFAASEFENITEFRSRDRYIAYRSEKEKESIYCSLDRCNLFKREKEISLCREISAARSLSVTPIDRLLLSRVGEASEWAPWLSVAGAFPRARG